ncbi:MAG: hypothetical protein KC546_01875 [Anaerolineae bacterium]|nr:hypothetical protein [Anaerolineae bacterium]
MSDSSIGFDWSISDDGIIVYHFRNSRREAIDTWIGMTRQHRDDFLAQGKPLKRIWFFHDAVMPTPYAVQKAIQLAKEVPPDMPTQVACVVTNQRIYTLIRYVFSVIDTRKDYIQFFGDEASALDWLRTTNVAGRSAVDPT